MTPVNPIVESLLSRLTPDLREAFEERAGIMQFEAGHTRELAEALAMLEVIRTNPLAVSGLVALDMLLDGEPLTIVTADLPLTQQHLKDIHARVVAPVDLVKAVRRMGMAAVLRPLG